MRSYQTAYPLFYQKVNELEVLTNRKLCFDKLTNEEVVFLNKQLEILIELKSLFEKQPTISSVNFENLVNETYKKDNTVHLISINVILHPTPDLSRVSKIDVPLFRSG